MMLILVVKMFFLLFLCPVMLGAGVQTLTIDTQLGTSTEDCFERISIGEQIPFDAIYRNVSELTTRECETICKQDKQCQSYDYGVGAKGNATCNLSMADEKEIKENRMLLRHPDYDVYIRRLNCEQSPPKPIQIQSDDPNSSPANRPVFRPNEDDRITPNDDLKPFETFRPEYKPIPPYRPYRKPNRPDDNNQKPFFDLPPSYGDHKPVEIPYAPEKPSFKPDPYDVLHFKPHNERPQRPLNPAFWRPDPYHPPQPDDDIQDLYGPKPKPPLPLPPYVASEKPIYHYFIRPPRKPQQTQIQRPDYGQDHYSYNTRPEYGQEPIPNRPYDYPLRPYDKPIYSYNSQYAGSYGHDPEPVYVEIVDPPRPYRPIKPYDERPTNNYGGFDQNNHEYSQTNGYGANQSNGYKPNYGYGAKPSRPLNYGGFDQDEPYSQSLGYGSHRPHESEPPVYQKPLKPPLDNYGSRPTPENPPSYSVTENTYEDIRPQTFIPYYYHTTSKPGNPYYQPGYERPSYTDNDFYESSGYKNNRYRPTRPIESSVIKVDKNDNGYKPVQGNDKVPVYGQERNPSYNKEPANGYNNPSDTYAEKPGERPNNEKPYGERPKPASYGQQRPVSHKDSSNNYKPSPSHGNQASYGNEVSPYDHQPTPAYQPKPLPSYGNPISNYSDTYDRPDSTYHRPDPPYKSPDQRPSYLPELPDYEYPTYSKRPLDSSYIYGPNGEVVTSRPVAVSSYGRPDFQERKKTFEGPMHGKAVVCYVATWAVYRPGAGKFSLEDLEPSLCTHLVYSFAGLNETSNTIRSLDPWQDLEKDYGKAGYRRIVALKERYPHLKVTIAIGGWNEGSYRYSMMAEKPETRQDFIKSVLQFLENYKFDGLDLDWEYPAKRDGRPMDKDNYVALVRELKEAFEPRGYILTAALGAGKDTMEAAYELTKLSRYLDLIHMMCYDYHGTWDGKFGANAPIRDQIDGDTYSVEFTIKYLLSHGVSPYKMVLGLPMYGRTFVLQDASVEMIELGKTPVKSQGFKGPYTKEAGFMGYNEICEELANKSSSWQRHWDMKTMTPYLRDGDRLITYDDTRAIAAKVQLAIQYNLGGLMVWSIDTDDFKGLCEKETDAYIDFQERWSKLADSPVMKKALKNLNLSDASDPATLSRNTAYYVEQGQLSLRLPQSEFTNYNLMRTINDATTLALQEKRILDEIERVMKENEIDVDDKKGAATVFTINGFLFVFSLCFLLRL